MILSKTRITKALIRLRECAGWSAPVCSQNTEDRLSRVAAQLCYVLYEIKMVNQKKQQFFCQIGNFLVELENTPYYLAMGMGLNFGPKIG